MDYVNRTCQWIVNFSIACKQTLPKEMPGIYCPGHLRMYEEAKVAFKGIKPKQRNKPATNKELPKKTWDEDFKFPSLDYRISEDLPHSE